MEFKGTLGKWEYEKELWHNASYENRLWMYTKKGSICQTLCEVNGFGISKQEAKANALLISKAPEMLEMLNYISENTEQICNDSGMGYIIDYDYMDKIIELIKQATEL